jgi:NDP-sugar pyrophosphorylase family protein
MENFFNNTFVVYYGDNLTDFDLRSMIKFHRAKQGEATIALFESPDSRQVGTVELAEGDRIISFKEKQVNNGVLTRGLANAAIYVLEPSVLNHIPKGISDFAYDVFPKMIADCVSIYGYRIPPDAYFIDTGTMQNYERANADVKAGKLKVTMNNE